MLVGMIGMLVEMIGMLVEMIVISETSMDFL